MNMKKMMFAFVALAFIISSNPAAAEVGGTITKTAPVQISAYQAAVNKIIVTFLQIVEWKTADGTLTFTDTNYSINQGCNTIFGTYTINRYQMTLSEPASTMMACESSLMTKDQEMTKHLSQVTTMKFTDGKMVMSGEKSTMSFTPKFVMSSGK